MAALSVIGANLIDSSMIPLSLRTGATSASDPTAGTTAAADPATSESPITTKDKAGAGILTVLVIAFIIGGGVWILR
jgi:mannan endo-1,6-alpha-mannosidase